MECIIPRLVSSKFSQRVEEEKIYRRLCRKVYSTLPRELRDIVYSYVLLEDINRVVEVSAIRPTPTQIIECFDDFEEPEAQFWDERRLGKGMKRELAETWYRSCHFNICGPFHMLERFLVEDRWSTGLIPQEFVSNVHISVSQEDKDVECLLKLLDLKPKAKISIYLYRKGWMTRTKVLSASDFFLQLLKQIFPVLHQLRVEKRPFTLILDPPKRTTRKSFASGAHRTTIIRNKDCYHIPTAECMDFTPKGILTAVSLSYFQSRDFDA
ncbi:hypothetical protein CC78DRAFT_548265 [Lojkania enalia]|uniref:Uncharacterized protein n=1 Tax=Lojkania enalia TaxID=147567 RepID=A0A9P4K014_9PLEO|nr:hypothetical protein CC78DRAFT_548265 [Didymosphaeria enalia]